MMRVEGDVAGASVVWVENMKRREERYQFRVRSSVKRMGMCSKRGSVSYFLSLLV